MDKPPAYVGPFLCAALAVSAGCSTPPPRPESPSERARRIEDTIATHRHDPWPYYERGALDEELGDLGRAVDDYGTAVSLLPSRNATRAAFALGRVHWKLNHVEPARRMLEEVVTTIPSDSRSYVENPDFREAALLLRDVYAREKDARSAEKMRARFLDQFGGKPEEWPEGK